MFQHAHALTYPVLIYLFLAWSAYGFPPESLDYSKFDILFYGTYSLLDTTHIVYGDLAFAIPDTSGALIWDSDAQAFLKRLVASAKKSGKGTKIVLSVGPLHFFFAFFSFPTDPHIRWLDGKRRISPNCGQFFDTQQVRVDIIQHGF
jgi:hypothetical protein